MIEYFSTHEFLVQSTFISILLAMSIQFPLRMGVFTFSGVGCYGVGSYVAGSLVVRQEVSTFTAVAVAALGGAVVGVGLGLLLRHLNGMYLGMASVAFDLIVAVIATNGGDLTGGASGLYGILAEPQLTTWGLGLLALVVVIPLAASEFGRMGRRVSVVREDTALAQSLGINASRYRLVAFVVSSVLGALAGALNVLLVTTVSPVNVGFSLVTMSLTMIVIGGTRTWIGAALGAIVLTWLPPLLESVAEWRPFIYSSIVAVFAIYFPRGLTGMAAEAWRGHRQRQSARRGNVDASQSQHHGSGANSRGVTAPSLEGENA